MGWRPGSCSGARLAAALGAFAALPSRLRAGRRHRLEHVAECPPPLVARIAALGLVVVTNPAFVHWRGDAYLGETAAPARAWLYRARTLLRAGIPLAGASDAPVVPASPWVGIAAARARRTAAGAALGAADEDPEVRALVFGGRGPAFSTGGDVREFGSAPSPFIARAVRWRRDVWGRLLELRAATIAAVHGYAVGGGMEIALLCDLCVAADDERFALPETGLGMIPGVGGTQTLPRKAGAARALDLVLTGRWLDARAALAPGLVHRVVVRARLEATALALAHRLARPHPAEVQAARRAVRGAHDLPLAAGVALERRLALALQGRP